MNPIISQKRLDENMRIAEEANAEYLGFTRSEISRDTKSKNFRDLLKVNPRKPSQLNGTPNVSAIHDAVAEQFGYTGEEVYRD